MHFFANFWRDHIRNGHVNRWFWSAQVNSHLAKIDHCYSEGGDKTFFTYHVITWSMSHVDRRVRFPHSKQLQGTENSQDILQTRAVSLEHMASKHAQL